MAFPISSSPSEIDPVVHLLTLSEQGLNVNCDVSLGSWFVVVESRLPLPLSAWTFATTGMDSSGLDRVVKDYLAAKCGTALDYFVIENRMSPDANGDMGVTGTYRRRAGEKNIFFTLTFNLASRKVQNFQEYG